MIVVSTSLLNGCFTRLICPSFDIHEETVLIICSLKVRFLSKDSPRSLTVSEGSRAFPKRERRNSGIFSTICLLPYMISLVLSGFSNRPLSKHQLRRLTRSSFIAAIDVRGRKTILDYTQRDFIIPGSFTCWH